MVYKGKFGVYISCALALWIYTACKHWTALEYSFTLEPHLVDGTPDL